MEKIPTAEEFLTDYDRDIYCQGPVYSDSGYSGERVLNIMRDFAQLHVEAALKAVLAESCKQDLSYAEDEVILNAYPPENIK